MVQRSGGNRRKTRHKLKKPLRRRGKVSVNACLQEFKQGDKVLLAAEPAVQGGMYHPRYHGKIGVIGAKQGECYYVTIKDFAADKKLLIHPVHLTKR